MTSFAQIKEEGIAEFDKLWPLVYAPGTNVVIENPKRTEVKAFLASLATKAYEQGKRDEYRNSVEMLIPDSVRIIVEARNDTDDKDAIVHIFTKEQIQSNKGKYFRMVLEDLAATIATAPILKSWIMSKPMP